VYIAIVLVTFFIFFAFGVISYAFNSLGLYEIAKRENEKNSFFSWIPYLNKYTLGRIAFKSNIHAVIMAMLVIIEFVITMVMMFLKNVKVVKILAILASILSLIICIYTFIAHYKIFKKYSKSVILMTILDVLSLGILGPFFIFAVRNNQISDFNSKVDEKF